ncbi:hypothetical protein HK096_000176, partial [Nowakowskiella sp. JEL0078]
MKTVITILVLAALVHAQIDYSTHVSRVNQLRSAAGVGSLTIDSRLNSCAQSHSQDMNDNVGLSHAGSDGSTPGQRIQKCVGVSNIFAGENAGAGYDNDISVIVAWFNSPEHKANLLNGNYNSIGIGRVGTYWVEVCLILYPNYFRCLHFCLKELFEYIRKWWGWII